MSNAKRGVAYSGNNKRGALTIPAHAHPLVRRFFAELNAQRTTLAEVSERSNVGVDTMRFWATRHTPRVDLLDAALNTIDLELVIRKRRAPAREAVA